jgi:hypothetical protein
LRNVTFATFIPLPALLQGSPDVPRFHAHVLVAQVPTQVPVTSTLGGAAGPDDAQPAAAIITLTSSNPSEVLMTSPPWWGGSLITSRSG